MTFVPLFIIVSLFLNTGVCDVIYVGGIFDSGDDEKETAFGVSINRVNDLETLAEYTLMPVREHIEPDNPLDALQKTCHLLGKGVVGIFGPVSDPNSNGVQSVCDTKEIPHIETRFDPNPIRGLCMLNLHPYPPTLARAFVDLVRAWEWKSFTILYEDDDGFARIDDLLRMYDSHGYTVVIKQLDKHGSGNYRPVLKEAWKSKETHFILDCNIDHLEEIMRQCQQIGLMTNKHKYIITNLDLYTIDLEPFMYSETNITGVRLVDTESPKFHRMVASLDEMRSKNAEEEENEDEGDNPKMRVETALMVDAVDLFAEALRELETANEFNVRPLHCNTTENWEHGFSVINFMKTNTINGLTGTVKFDHQGFRSDFNLDVIELSEQGVVKIGTWNSTEGLNITRSQPEVIATKTLSLVNESFIVITALTDPYGMLKESQESLSGNDRFEGFGIDLIDELAKMEGFTYTFVIRADGSNGAKNPDTGKWSGMIGDVMEGRAHLAITDLTINSERAEAVDFAGPFMNLGISILYKKPKKAPPNFFSFAEPFALEVWLWLGGAYFLVSMSLFVMGRLCSGEWTNPYPCIEEPEYLINQFSLRNSFWFTIGSLMQQGTEIAPIAVATRMTAGMWWFFTLIMVSSYTANLAAFLTTENPDQLFSNVHELVQKAEKGEVQYGAKKDGATANFFRDSNVEDYQKIHAYMTANKDEVMTSGNLEGVIRAESEDKNYAFFMESTSIEYETQRHCKLMQIGDLLDEKGYGIAMKKNSPYRDVLSTAVLKLQENGKLALLKRKWWEERKGGGQCSGEVESQEAKPLNLKNVEGVFWVTVGGTVLACFCVFLEMVLHTLKEAVKFNATFIEEFKEEMKFYFKFTGNVKPVRMKAESKSPDRSHKSEENLTRSYADLVMGEAGKKSSSK